MKNEIFTEILTEIELKQKKLRKIIGRTLWILLPIIPISLMIYGMIVFPYSRWIFGSFGIGFAVGFPLVLLIAWLRDRSKPKDEANGE